MDYTYQPKQSNKRLVAVVAVLALHAFIVYALVTGLARKVVEVIKKPIEAKIVEEVKLPHHRRHHRHPHRPRRPRTCRHRRLLLRRRLMCRRWKSLLPRRLLPRSPRPPSRPRPSTRSRLRCRRPPRPPGTAPAQAGDHADRHGLAAAAVSSGFTSGA